MPKNITAMEIKLTSITEPLAATIVIHLIREDLKSRKFFEALRDIGLNDAFYQADLLDLIMAAMGLPLDSQECYNFCHNILREHSNRITQDPDKLRQQARRVYAILTEHAMRYSKPK